jgi:hypothetical protein
VACIRFERYLTDMDINVKRKVKRRAGFTMMVVCVLLYVLTKTNRMMNGWVHGRGLAARIVEQ